MEMTVREFVDELIAEIEDRLEGHLEPVAKSTIERTLTMEIVRIEKESSQ